MLKENYSKVLENVNAAAKRAGRNPSDVTLIAVGKMHEPGELQEVYEAGCRDFGENKVQELTGKIVVLPKDIRWHLIGHLQRNKVKYIAGKTSLIHSVDSLRLAEEIEVQTNKLNDGSLVSDILLAGRNPSALPGDIRTASYKSPGSYDGCTICRRPGRKSFNI